MNGDTQLFTKSANPNDKHPDSIGRISIRAWLAIVLIGAVVMRSMSVAVVVAMYVHSGKIEPLDAVKMLDITEPLYTMSGMALAYYFGNQQQRQQAAQQQAVVTPPEK